MGLRIAIGEEKRHIYRSLITESIFIGLAGSVVGTAFGLFFASLLTKGIDIGGMMQGSNMMMQGVMKAQDHPGCLLHRIYSRAYSQLPWVPPLPGSEYSSVRPHNFLKNYRHDTN